MRFQPQAEELAYLQHGTQECKAGFLGRNEQLLLRQVAALCPGLVKVPPDFAGKAATEEEDDLSQAIAASKAILEGFFAFGTWARTHTHTHTRVYCLELARRQLWREAYRMTRQLARKWEIEPI